MKIVVADRNLSPHRERFEAQLPAGSTVVWHCETTHPDLAEAEVFVGSTFTVSMARSANKLRLVHVAGAGTDCIDFGALPFADLENLVLTPHTSGITRQTFLGRVDDITANIRRVQRGELLANIVAN